MAIAIGKQVIEVALRVLVRSNTSILGRDGMSEQNHIVVDARMLGNSGIGTYLQQVLDGLVDRFRWTLLGDLEVIERMPWADRVQGLTCSVPVYSPLEHWSLPRLVPECDLFWSPHYNTPWRVRQARVRVVTLHDVNHLALPDVLNGYKRLYARMLINNACRQADKVITVSNFSAQEIVRYTVCAEEKIEVIPNGVAPSSLGFTTPSQAMELLERLKGEPAFLFVGNLKPHKNLMFLLRAFVSFRKNYPKAHLIVVGNIRKIRHPDEEALKALSSIDDEANIHLLESIPDSDLVYLYQNCRALVCPSLYEGFGLPVAEAMSAACPVVVSDIAVFHELCADAAVYFDPKSEQTLENALEKLLADAPLRESCRQKSQERSERFSWESSCAAHAEVFLDLLNDE